MKLFLLSSSLLIHLFAFCQCDEYYINELISGNDDKCYFGVGTKVRFCPNLQGMAIGELTLDISQWDGISTQYITVTKNGGIAGTVVLKLNEKELLLNLNGCGGSRTYSISLNKTELEKFKKIKDNDLIIKINELVSKNEFEKAFELTSKLMQKSNYEKLSELEKTYNEHRLSNYRIIISKTKDAIEKKDFVTAAKLFSDIKLPTKLAEGYYVYNNTKSTIEAELKNIYKDSMIVSKTNFQFSNDNSTFIIKKKDIVLNKEILNNLDSISDGNYFLRISLTPDKMALLYPGITGYPPAINYDILAKRFGISFEFKNGSLLLTCVPGGSASQSGLPSRIEVKTINGKTFTNDADPQNYVADFDSLEIIYLDTLTNTFKEHKIKRELKKLVSLPGDQKKCTRWMQNGECVDYYTSNLINGWTKDSLKTVNVGFFSVEVTNLIPFKLERQIENPTISFYTKSGETLKLYNESYYRKVKGQKYLKQVTISNEAVQDNTLIKSRVGTLNYIVNGKVNYSIDNKRINSSLPIIDRFPTDR